MTTHRFVAASTSAALQMVRAALGEDACIVSTDSVTDGIEVVATPGTEAAYDRSVKASAVHAAATYTEPVVANEATTAAVTTSAVNTDAVAGTVVQQTAAPTLAGNAVVADRPVHAYRACRSLHRRVANGRAPTGQHCADLLSLDRPVQIDADRRLPPAPLMPLRSSATTHALPAAANDEQQLMATALLAAGFTDAVTQRFLRHIVEAQAAGSATTLQDELRILLMRELSRRHTPLQQPPQGVVVLHGLPGSGKTLCAARLALIQAKLTSCSDVLVICNDHRKAAARSQLYGYLMNSGVQIRECPSEADLLPLLEVQRQRRLVVIDQPSWRDEADVDVLCEALNSFQTQHQSVPVQHWLVVSALCRQQPLLPLLQQGQHPWHGCIVTAIDYLQRYGDLLEWLLQTSVPCRYYSASDAVDVPLYPISVSLLVDELLAGIAPQAVTMPDSAAGVAASGARVSSDDSARIDSAEAREDAAMPEPVSGW